MTTDAAGGSASPGLPRTHGLSALFQPRAIAVIGASADRGKIGGRPLHHLTGHGFAGPIYPINPNHAEVQGHKAYPSLGAVPGEVDLAIIAVPHHGVLDAVRSCADKGVETAVLFSAGFSEAGAAGTALQRDVLEIAASAGMRVLGPNCIGAANLRAGTSATFTFAVELPRPAGPLPRVALVSQSGAIGGHCVSLAPARGFQFDPWVTTGNEGDIDAADCIGYFVADDDVSAIAVYLEGCRDGARLKAALETAYRKRKPVVVVKAGQSEAGAGAAASHTASLVGSDQTYDALFQRYNVCRVGSISELVDVAQALAIGRIPAGRKTGIVTSSGGAGILMADAAVAAGLDVAPLPLKAQGRLKEIWPPAGVQNPIDTTGQVTDNAGLLTAFLETMLDEADYDVVLVFLSFLGMMAPWSDNVLASLEKVRATHPGANLVVSALATEPFRRAVHRLGIPVFDELTDAVRAVARTTRIGAGFGRSFADVPPAGVPRLAGDERPTEVSAKRLLAAAGVPVLPETVARSAEQAADAADALGYPVVVKVLSPDVAHKTEAGGVVVGLSSRESVIEAYTRVVRDVGTALPDAEITGVLVAPMVQGGVEVILGVRNDPSLGPAVMFGLGGIFVEVLGDLACRLAPFDVDEAEAMIRETRGYDLLNGARGRGRFDVPALAQALSSLSVVAAANADRIETIDVNPFIVLPEGRGAVAVDALITTTGED
ncbi:MAG TPA: acetate--CoA ligase family protein [Amycolatopsis sp.]|nr:acetate--CoA ligase family protein [Amycolatopsis sp.]